MMTCSMDYKNRNIYSSGNPSFIRYKVFSCKSHLWSTLTVENPLFILPGKQVYGSNQGNGKHRN